MTILRSLRRHPLARPAVATAVVAVIWLAAATLNWVEGSAKSADLGDGPADEDLQLRIDLAFMPEAFHMNYFQSVGRIAKTDGQRIYLRGVDRQTALSIARRYWIQDVSIWTEGNG